MAASVLCALTCLILTSILCGRYPCNSHFKDETEIERLSTLPKVTQAVRSEDSLATTTVRSYCLCSQNDVLPPVTHLISWQPGHPPSGLASKYLLTVCLTSELVNILARDLSVSVFIILQMKKLKYRVIT